MDGLGPLLASALVGGLVGLICAVAVKWVGRLKEIPRWPVVIVAVFAAFQAAVLSTTSQNLAPPHPVKLHRVGEDMAGARKSATKKLIVQRPPVKQATRQ